MPNIILKAATWRLGAATRCVSCLGADEEALLTCLKQEENTMVEVVEKNPGSSN